MSRKTISSILFVIIAVVAVLFGANEWNGGQQHTADQTAQTAGTTTTSPNRSGSSTSSSNGTASTTTVDQCTIINTFDGVANYLRQHNGQLPCNYITKKQAERLGWDSSKGNLAKVAPGKSIGGDTFSNREGRLPKASGRKWHEADINYTSGFRGADRILYSTDGLIYKTTDHYRSFQQMK
ncbi:ribonuclease [Paenibacillus campi]|uniref:ribonuclease n=1 Tax=Paenibacillus campi TaxID=3106031 RepID=UPI002AFF4025|nr:MULTISPECIES: ribonuclease domain-containing protein [unclassified Paenibacillus]